MIKKLLFVSLAGLAVSAVSGRALATDWELGGGVVLTHQQTNQQNIASETAASADLVLTKQQLSGGWLIHVEAASTVKPQGIASNLPEANTDAGSALTKSGKGRLQLSELYYQHQFNNNQQLSVGLLDVSGFFEQSRIASDEATQFLGAFFTGNPVIEFPDYTLGVVYEHTLAAGPVLRAAITSSNGLADNSTRSYNQLLSVHDGNKGIFAATSISWRSQAYLLRLGAWANTADHTTLDGNQSNADNYGVYMLTGYQVGRHAWNMRLGVANEKVSSAAAFTGLSYQYTQGDYVLGLGMARAYLSSEASSLSNSASIAQRDTQQYELYLRYTLAPDIYLTGDVQAIVNSDFKAAADNTNRVSKVYGARLSWLFG